MKLLDHFVHAGDTLFRWRSYLPLLLLPLFLLSAREAGEAGSLSCWERIWQFACLAVSLAGLAVRVYTIGAAPPGTSERSTTGVRAASLTTTGAYSVIRHPLYFGNMLVVLGLALFVGTWQLPLLIVLVGVLYHERIAAREEHFLEERFGDEFRRWADRVPAMVPAFRRFQAPRARFRWRRVLGREFHALFVIGAGFFVLDVVRRFMTRGTWAIDPVWAALAAATGVLFVALAVLKRTTGLFDEQGGRTSAASTLPSNEQPGT